MPFRDRLDAGRKLSEKLARYTGEACVVLALPRGGVPVAAPVAEALGAPLDLILVRKIGVPTQPELAMGAVVDGTEPLIVRNEDIIRSASVSEAEFEAVCTAELKELERRRKKYLSGREPLPVAGRVAIVIDDGIATGATTRAALRSVRARGPKKLVLAVPVAPSDAIDPMRADTDEFVCLEHHRLFGAIGLYYADFRQVSDDEVIRTLARLPPPPVAR